MGINFKIIICFLQFWKFFSPILALIYLILHLTQFLNEDLFKIFDKFFGIFPNFINSKMYVEVDLFGKDAPMGYVYAACICVITMFVAAKMYNHLDKIQKIKEDEKLKKEAEKKLNEKKQKQKQKEQVKIKKINTYYGLFELKLEYISGLDKSQDDLMKLKCEYSKMVAKKIKEKYPQISFAFSDKIFLTTNDFSTFPFVVKDLIRLYKVLFDIDKKRYIQTGLLLCFWTTCKMINPKSALKILLKINGLKLLNKVIISKEIYSRYLEENNKDFDFIPLGPSKLYGAQEDGGDIDVELYYIKNTKK